MLKAARVRVTVDFAGRDRPAAYTVHVEPEGGEAVGKWSGSGNINAENQIAFDDIPPGRYVVRGQPNPSTADQRTEPLSVQLLGGQTAEIQAFRQVTTGGDTIEAGFRARRRLLLAAHVAACRGLSLESANRSKHPASRHVGGRTGC